LELWLSPLALSDEARGNNEERKARKDSGHSEQRESSQGVIVYIVPAIKVHRVEHPEKVKNAPLGGPHGFDLASFGSKVDVDIILEGYRPSGQGFCAVFVVTTNIVNGQVWLDLFEVGPSPPPSPSSSRSIQA
jgi:hypothetical protein